jgi:hypothetical protein
MEAKVAHEMLVSVYQTTRHHTLEVRNLNLQNHRDLVVSEICIITSPPCLIILREFY